MPLKRCFTWHRPGTIQEAWEMLKEKNAVLIGGGTDIVPLISYGLVTPYRLISLESIKELSEITWRGEEIFIGSTVTLTQLAEERGLYESIPVLAEASLRVASPQIRNIATIGGNIFQSRRCIYFNQSSTWHNGIEPCLKLGGVRCYQAPRGQRCLAIYHSDLSPVMVALGAEAVFYNDGHYSRTPLPDVLEKMVDLPQSLNGYDQGLCTGFVISQAMVGSLSHFYKYSIRRALDFALANFACSLLSREHEPEIVISVGAIASKPLLLEKTAAKSTELMIDGDWDSSRIQKVAIEELAVKSSLIKDSGVSVSHRKRILELVARELASTMSQWNRDR